MPVGCTCSYATGYARALYVEAGNTKFCLLHMSEVATAIAAAKADAWKRAIGWVDYYLAMKLHDAARGGLEDLRKRMAHEAEHGPPTSVPMGGDHLKPEAR